MKKIITYIMAFFLTGVLFLSSCTDNFEKYNINPIGVSEEELKQDYNHIGAYFPPMEQMIYCNYNWGWGIDWTFQVMQNLNADIWSGYMASATNFASGVNNQTYSLVAGWNDAAWDYTYAYMMPNTLTISKKCQEDYGFYSHFDAVNKIVKVSAMARLCDMFGPIIYSQYGQTKTGGTYDSGQEAYANFFKELTEAVDTLNHYVEKNPSLKPFARFDMAYGGDYTQWIKYANTLHLRLAMRVVKYDAAMAKREGEAAMAAPYGLITVNKDNFTISGKNYSHPVYAISQVWGDISVSANLESILSGYQDPRIDRFASLPKSGKSPVVKGMRTGIPNLDNFDYHPIVSPVNLTSASPVVLMTAAESYFLQAEAALRGWNTNGKTAKDLYNTGVRTSFDQWAVSIGDYLTSNHLPAAFTDQLQPAVASSLAVCKVTPNWDSATTNEERLEKIITQKWIAGFPEGYNAWAELRRTGYPKLFSILKNDSQGLIPTETGPRRIPFSSAEKSGNAAGVADAVSKLGGPDNGATRLFWDINKGNF